MNNKCVPNTREENNNVVDFYDKRIHRKNIIVSRASNMRTTRELLRAMETIDTNDLRNIFVNYVQQLPAKEINKIDRIYMGTQSFLISIKEKQLLKNIMEYLSCKVFFAI